MLKTRTIPLTQGAVTTVDEGDYEKLIGMGAWHLSSTGYAVMRNNYNGVKKTVRMHRIITNCPVGLVVDHLNHDPLDNRKINLRICTQSENMRNKSNQGKGYWYQKQNKNWVVEINGLHRGTFDTEEQASNFATLVRLGLVHKKIKFKPTHCHLGHSLVDAYHYNGKSFCRQCQSIKSKNYYRRKHANKSWS